MDVSFNSHGMVHITLSRRNILALLAKLDGFPVGSAKTIERQTGDWRIAVTAQEDGEHYGARQPGVMHPVTEANL